MGAFFEDIGGRKFCLAVVLTILSVTLFALGKMDTEQLKGFLEWIYGLFVVGNVSQKFSPSIEEK